VFCDEHMKAPPGRRGGWLSAWKKKQAMAPSPMGTQHVQVPPYTDFSNVAPPGSSMKLYVGAKPPPDRELQFDVVVLCAAEYQPARMTFRGELVHCPIPDDALSKEEIRQVLNTSSLVAAAIAAKKRVLVTCRAGINRSALVAALALAKLTRMTPAQIMIHLREKRHPDCLFNTHFQTYLRRFVEGSRQIPPGRDR